MGGVYIVISCDAGYFDMVQRVSYEALAWMMDMLYSRITNEFARLVLMH